jgi:gamma-carbonic anhydrase
MSTFDVIPFRGKSPRIHETAFVAPGCRIIGDVEIGRYASIWYNCVIRGDVNKIIIGARSNIQDGSVIHCDPDDAEHHGSPTIVEENVLVGHRAMLHGCTIRSNSVVGLGAIVMDGCVFEQGSMLAAGGMLTPGKTIPTGELWSGSPARFMRQLGDNWSAGNQLVVTHYVDNGQAHKAVKTADQQPLSNLT